LKPPFFTLLSFLKVVYQIDLKEQGGKIPYPFLCPSLLKTFSMNPFQGQYPNRLVRINATPINPRTHRKPPGVKKAIIIKMIPMTDRKIPSPLPTFLIFTNDSISSSL
jgi:hypothetical protein